MNGTHGSQATWEALFTQVFASFAALTGNTYIKLASDDGAAFTSTPGVGTLRGDVRIGGHPIDGNFGVLGYNFFPNGSDMVLDTDDSTFYGNTSNNSTALPNGTGPYFVRVFGNTLTADVQLYEVDIVIADAVSTATLTVSIAGSGTVTSTPAGITCAGDCTENYTTGTVVTLTATPDSGSTLSSIVGAADCSDASVTMNANTACKAVFTRTFSDDPPTQQVTSVQAAHINELRLAINQLRARRMLSSFTFTDSTLTAGTTSIRAVHIEQLRSALNDVYDNVGTTRPTYADTPITVGSTSIQALHLTQLRDAVRAIDSST